jgi:uncharacterized repeat protein (TIGR01451 family)
VGSIKLHFSGTRGVRLNASGNLLVKTPEGEVCQQKPRMYQEVNGHKREIAGGYRLGRNGIVGLKVKKYDHTLPLIIDPVLIYSTYLGGSGEDSGNGIAVDGSGNAYITGTTSSINFPVTSGAARRTNAGNSDVFVTKLNPTGSSIVYSTYIGGANPDIGNAVAVDAGGNAYIAGSTESHDFPINLSANPFQPNKAGPAGPLFKSTDAGQTWSNSFNGITSDSVEAIALDPSNSSTLYVATQSGAGIYKSIDGGNIWTASGSGLNGQSVQTVASHPTNPAILYAGICFSGAGVFRSVDGGQTWTPTTGFGASECINSIAVDPNNTNLVYAGGFSDLYKSIDGGLTFAKINVDATTTAVGIAIAIDPQSNVYVTTASGVYKSTDGGATWATNHQPLVSAGVGQSLEIDAFQRSLTLYLGTSGGGVFKSSDGLSWVPINNGLPAQASVQTVTLDRSTFPVTVYAGGSFGVYKSTDAGQSWNPTNLGSTAVYTLKADRRTPSKVFAGVFAGTDAFVAKLNNTGSALVYSTYLGGGSVPSDAFAVSDVAYGITSDSSGNAYITGSTLTANFPTQNAIQSFSAGGGDAFVTKLNATGTSLVYSTYLGGSNFDIGRAITVDNARNVYVTGETASVFRIGIGPPIQSGFPVLNAIQPSNAGSTDAFISKINPQGSAFVYSTYLGGSSADSGRGIAVDAINNVYITGSTASGTVGVSNSPGAFPTANALQSSRAGGTDAFVTKLNSSGSALTYSTYLGGSTNDQGKAIAVDLSGTAYVTGQTNSNNFPVANTLQSFGGGTCGTAACNDAFVTSLNPTGSAFNYSTYLGGSANDQGNSIAVGSNTSVFVTGTTNSLDFPTLTSLQPANGGSTDAFVTRLSTIPPADLSITMTDSPNPINLASDLTYTINVTNNGPNEATGVTVTDALPSTVTFVSASTACSALNQVVTCNIGRLGNGASTTLNIIVRTTVEGFLINEASVSADGPDLNTNNNTAIVITSVSPADLAVTLADSPDPVNSGSNITYAATINNNGPNPAVNIRLTDTLLPGITLVSVTSTQGTCTQSVGTITCNIGNLNIGSQVAVTIVVTPTRAELISHTVSVVANNPDPNTANNDATQVTTVNGVTGAIRNLQGFTVNSLPRNDDDSTSSVPLGFTLDFFGNPYNRVFVNNNGNVTFDSALGTFTPFDLTSTRRIIIAPFFADVDTRAGGSATVTYGIDTVNGRPAFGVNWINVGYFNFHSDKLNGFQLVLIDRSDISPGAFDIEFNYNKVQWETGDASGGTGGLGGSSARAGYSNGSSNRGTFFELSGSAVNGGFLDSNSSTGLINNKINSNQLGRYALEVRGGTVITGDLAVSLSDSPDPVAVGSDLTYTATVINNSSTPATGVILTDPLPSGVNLVSATSTQGNCTLSGITVTCNIGNMAARGTPAATVTATIVVRPSTAGTITDAVSVSGNETDTNPTNNSATVATQVVNLISITGRITDNNGVNLANVVVTLSGSQSATSSTDANGNYSFTVPSGGTYTVAASKAGFSFTPPSQTFASLVANQIANFTGALIQLTISGHIADANNASLAAVTATLSGSQLATSSTDANGNYSFTVPFGGTYTITVSKTGFTFTPPSQTFSNLDTNQIANFTGALIQLTISGHIANANNVSIANATVTLSGSQSATSSTDANGNYSFTVPFGGTYTITVSKTGFTFTPPSQTFSNLDTNQIANFTGALIQLTISGHIANANNVSIANATVTLSGSQSATSSTDANGNYSFTVPFGGTYTVSASKAGFTFTPPSQTFASLGANQIANFTGTARPLTVTSISPTSGPEAGGIQVTITGSNFATDGAGATTVLFGTIAASNVTVVNDTTITATAPGGLGQQKISVTNSFGTSTNLVVFTYIPPPLSNPQPAIMGTAGAGNLAIVFPRPDQNLPSPTQNTVTGLPGNASPHGVSYFGSDRALISDFGNSRIFVVQISTNSLLATIDTASLYNGQGTIAVAPDLKTALAMGGSNNLAVIRAPFDASSQVTTIALPGTIASYQTEAIVFSPTGTAFVYHIAGISVLNPPYSSVAFTIPITNPSSGALAISPDGNSLLATELSSGVVRIFTAPYSAASTPASLVIGTVGLDGIQASPDGTKAIVTAVSTPKAWAISAPFNSASLVEELPLAPAVLADGRGFEDVGISADGQFAILTGNGFVGAPAAFIHGPFTAAGARSFAVNINGGGRGNGAVRFLPAGLAPGLTISKTVAASVRQGSNLTYTISYANTGTLDASNVVIKDTLPAGTTFVSASNGGTINNGVVTWNVGTVSMGTIAQTLTFTVNVTAQPNSTVSNNNYSIEAENVAPIFGPPVSTTVTQVPTATISGHIADANNVSLPAVTVTLSGSLSATSSTDANGNYSFTVPVGGTYTIAVLKAGFTFTPPSQTFANLEANQTANFTGTLIQLTISGHIADANNASLAAVTATLSGSLSATSSTDTNGNYSFTVPFGGTYTVAVSKAGFTFTPPSQTFADLETNQTANFTGALIQLTISGHIADANNTSLAAVTLTLSGSQSATSATDANGNYSFTVPFGGTYTIAVSKTGFTFTPPSQTFANLEANQIANFTGALIQLTISGRIADATNISLAGVTVTLSGSQSATSSTDANGNYSFTVPFGGTYTVAASKAGFTFTPPSQTFANLDANQIANFTGTLIQLTISGRIADANNVGLPDVVVTLSGAGSKTTVTDANGNYSFENVSAIGSYTLTPTSDNFTFTPKVFTFANLVVNQNANSTGTSVPTPSPTPPPSEDFTGTDRDPTKFNLGTLTEGVGAFDPQVQVIQRDGQLQITPRSGVDGKSFNGYVTVQPLDITKVASVGIEVIAPSTGDGAETIFAIGNDNNNYYRFLITQPENETAAPVSGRKAPSADTTPAALFFQSVIGGAKFSKGINYNPTEHRFLRFRYDNPNIVFETSRDKQTWIEQLRRGPIKNLKAVLTEISAGTVRPTSNPGTAKFDNYEVIPLAVTTRNPSDDPVFFVTQQYVDFLNRTPDAGGLAYWTNQITRCGTDQRCINSRRSAVSAAFFIELEFQETGGFVYLIRRAAYNRQPTFAEFTADQSQIVSGPGLESTKQAFVANFVKTEAFRAKYGSLTELQYVDALYSNIGVDPTGDPDTLQERAELIVKLLTLQTTRAEVLQTLASKKVFSDREHNPSFVLMQYFGYLRRDPDQQGYEFWLDVLNNKVPNNYQAMVCAFITSAEYQIRFGTTVTHTNRECAP